MKILSVIVIYGQKANESLTVDSLTKNENVICSLFEDFEILIYDNNPKYRNPNLFTKISNSYFSDPSNSGLSAAYNFAFERAKNEFDWVLLLDQDTELTEIFFHDLNKAIHQCQGTTEVVSIVPKMSYHGNIFSPALVKWGAIHKRVSSKYSGVFSNGELMAVGSGMTLRLNFIASIGGFTDLFPLDCLDRWICLKIFQQKKKSFVMPTVLKHELSILDFNKHMNPQKYRNQINAEGLFMLKYKTFPEIFIFIVRLLWRSIYLAIQTHSISYSRHSILLIFLLLKSKFNPSNFIDIHAMEKK